MARHYLYHHFLDNTSIFFYILSGRCLHCFIGDWVAFNSCSVVQKKPHENGARRQRVRLILSSRKAGFISGLFVCPGLEDSWQPRIYLWWTSISLCKAGRQREEQLTSSAGSGQGWAIVMNIMCKYERRETKGWFCYGNAVIGTDWVLIRCVRMCSHRNSCTHAGNKCGVCCRLCSFLK